MAGKVRASHVFLSMVLGSCAADDGFRPALMPGSLQGWHEAPGGTWRWRGDVLVATSPKKEPRHGLLVSDARYADFEARLRFRVLSGDSGFYFRVEEVEHVVAVNGFQAELDRTLDTGGLYETGGRAWVVKPEREALAATYVPGEWARLRVLARGGDVDVFVNELCTAQLRDDSGRREGHLALQLHGGQDMHVEFRDLEVRELAP